MRERNSLKWGGTILGVTLIAALVAYPSTSSGNLTFTNTPLLRPDGNSEPEISIAANGTMGIVGPSWLNLGTNAMHTFAYHRAEQMIGRYTREARTPGSRRKSRPCRYQGAICCRLSSENSAIPDTPTASCESVRVTGYLHSVHPTVRNRPYCVPRGGSYPH